MKPAKISIKKVIKTLLWPHRKRLLLGLLLIFLGKIAGLVIPGAFKYLIDDVILKNQPELLQKIIIAVLLAVLVQAVSSFLLTKLLSIEAQRVIANLRVQIQKKILRFPLSFYEKNKSGEIAKRVMDDIDGIKNLIGTGLILFVGGIVTSLGALIILTYIHPKLTLYTVIPLIAMGLTSMKAYTYLRPIFRKRRQLEAEVQGRLTETLGGIKIVKGYHAEEQENKVFEKGAQSIFTFYNKSLSGQAFFMSLATLILGMAASGIMWLGSTMIESGELEVGEFISFILYLGFMVGPIIQMSNVGSLLTEAIAGLDRTEDLLNMPTEDDDPNRTITLPEIEGNLQMKAVSFSYSPEQPVLKDISISIKAGSSIALVGPSGAGKTTFAALVAGFVEPSRGALLVDGHDLKTLILGNYRHHLGLVLQDDFLFDGTVRENILFSKPDATESALRNAIEAAYVNEFTDRFPNGIDTVIGERGVKLSGGQKQRISIARALLSNPKILILDEATSSLDSESEMMIQESLTKLIEGRTTIIIAHRLSTIRNADLIIVLEQGSIIEMGNHEALLEADGKYAQLLRIQSRI